MTAYCQHGGSQRTERGSQEERQADVIMMKSSLDRQGQEERRVRGEPPRGRGHPLCRLALLLEKERDPAHLQSRAWNRIASIAQRVPASNLFTPGSPSSLSFCFQKWDATSLLGYLLSSSQRRIWVCTRRRVLGTSTEGTWFPGSRSGYSSASQRQWMDRALVLKLTN